MATKKTSLAWEALAIRREELELERERLKLAWEQLKVRREELAEQRRLGDLMTYHVTKLEGRVAGLQVAFDELREARP